MNRPNRKGLKSLPHHFWDRVKKVGPCWLWTGECGKSGRGIFEWKGKLWSIHRLVWSLLHGPIPPKIQILHRCDIGICLNPRHLRAGTYLENIQDRVKRNRTVVARGEESRFCKLSDLQVKRIRKLRQQGWTFVRIGRRYRINPSWARRLALGLRRNVERK